MPLFQSFPRAHRVLGVGLPALENTGVDLNSDFLSDMSKLKPAQKVFPVKHASRSSGARAEAGIFSLAGG